MADLAISLGRFHPPLAEPPFEMGHLELLVEEVDLTAEGLALLVHRSVSVNFGHEAPIMDGEFVELATEHYEHGSAPTEGGNEPRGWGPCRVFIVVVIIRFWGI